MTRTQLEKWIRDEVAAAYCQGCPDCPPGCRLQADECSGCPYRDLFSDSEFACTRMEFCSDEHKTAACFLAAIFGVEL